MENKNQRIKENRKIKKILRFEQLTKENLKIATKVEFEIFPSSSAYLVYKEIVTKKKKSFYISYIAYWDDKPIGVIGLYEIPKNKDTLWVSWFGLLKEYRNLGLGKQMMDFISDIAKKYNKKFLRLYTFEIWNKEAQTFYKNYMYIEEDYYNDREDIKDIFDGKYTPSQTEGALSFALNIL